MNIIDIGCSFIKSYLILDGRVVDCQKMKTNADTILQDTILCFAKTGSERSQSTMIISTSDSIVWEDHKGNAHWIEHQTPKNWQDGHPTYEVSGHPCYDMLKGAANQMLYVQRIVGLKNIKRILPLSAYIATMIADNPDWNGWDITHASNSGFYDYQRGRWAKEADPFIDAGVIDETIYSCDHRVEGNTFRRIYLGGHDSVFANANDGGIHTKPYTSCGTWTTHSVPVYPIEDFREDKGFRYVKAPNGIVLKQMCYPSTVQKLPVVCSNLYNFFTEFCKDERPTITLFGSWSEEIKKELKETDKYKIDWIAPNRFFGDIYLPIQAGRYVRNSPNFVADTPYFCEGA